MMGEIRVRVSKMQIIGFFVLYGLLAAANPAWAKTRYWDFVVQEAPYTRLCNTKSILTVNGQFPGPTIYARKGDTVIVRVSNQGGNNITFHWHGVDQPRNPWSDGPEYVTQCPIRPGANMTYTLLLSEEEGTIWWHSHSDWDRATVNGAIVIQPRRGTNYPFPKPDKEITMILGEWWIGNVSDVLEQGLRGGGEFNVSDAYTINGQPGDQYNCSAQEMFKAAVEYGKTYLLRIVNAAMNNELFFAVGGHNLTVVGTDAAYTKPWTHDFIMITPGQTMDVLLHANASAADRNRYYIAARAYSSANSVRVNFNRRNTTAIIEYTNSTGGTNGTNTSSSPLWPNLPDYNNTAAATNFIAGLRSLASADHPINVPATVDEQIIITVSVNLLQCQANSTCVRADGTRLAASLNNISFVSPKIDILSAYYNNIGGIYNESFPSEPPFNFNFTADFIPRNLFFPDTGTDVRVLEYNKSIEIVFQGTNILAGENHPMHLHGQSFYVVGRGFGNYDKQRDPQSYNLVDPPLENTVGVPVNGWAAVRFRTLNPGVWFMHCHLERHLSWGMDTVFIVKNGLSPQARVLPPPRDMPSC